MRFSRVCLALVVATAVSAAVGLWYVAARPTAASGLGFGENTAALRQRLAQAGVRVEGYEFRWLRGSLYEVTGPHGRRRVLNFADAAGRQDRAVARAPKVIEIRVPEVDTTGFAARFRHMATLPISNGGGPAVVSDTDQDGLAEVTAGPARLDEIWERANAASDSFHRVYEITEPYHASLLTSDVNSNTLPELVFQVAPGTAGRSVSWGVRLPSTGFGPTSSPVLRRWGTTATSRPWSCGSPEPEA